MTTPRSPIPGVHWNARTSSWHVRVQGGPHRGSYGYYHDHDEAATVAELAFAGMAIPGASTRSRHYRRVVAPLHGPHRPPKTGIAPTDPLPNNTSGFRGVSWNSSLAKWHVRIRVAGRYASFGVYDDLAVAAEVARRVYAGELTPRTRRR